jgi:hypothetical protein
MVLHVFRLGRPDGSMGYGCLSVEGQSTGVGPRCLLGKLRRVR